MGEDFNARTGNRGELITGVEEHGDKSSKDKEINKEEKNLLKLIEERGWNILNGNMRGDESGEYTFIGARGYSVIDYIIVNSEALNKTKKMKVGCRCETEHQPVIMEIKGTRQREKETRD